MSGADQVRRGVGRRGLFVGAGVAALAGAAATLPGRADAAPSPGPARGRTSADGGVSARSTPVTDTLASTPVSGWTYRYLSMFDFSHEDGTKQRRWGGRGVYTDGTLLHGTLEIPAGARVREVEWYMYNDTGASVQAYARLWRAGVGTLGLGVCSATIPVNGDAITRTRVLAPSTNYGPFPQGCKLDLLVNSSGPELQVNGARVGFDRGEGRLAQLSTPVRVYDSRETTKFGANEVRTLTLPDTVVVPGVTGLNITLHALEGAGDGNVRVWPVGVTEPTLSLMHYQGSAIATTVTVGVSSARQIRIRTSKAVHLVIDANHTIC